MHAPCTCDEANCTKATVVAAAAGASAGNGRGNPKYVVTLLDMCVSSNAQGQCADLLCIVPILTDAIAIAIAAIAAIAAL